MARPFRIQYPGAFCHITSRGNELKDVFKSQKDRDFSRDRIDTWFFINSMDQEPCPVIGRQFYLKRLLSINSWVIRVTIGNVEQR